MKTFFFCLLLLAAAAPAGAQKLSGASAFTPAYSDYTGTRIDTARIIVQFDKPLTADTTIELDLVPNDLPDKPKILLDKRQIVITMAALNKNTDNRDTIAIPIAYQTRSRMLPEDEVAYIVVKGRPEAGAHTVRISSARGYTPDQPFWVEIGANVDLAEWKFNNLFGGVFLYRRDWSRLSRYKPFKGPNSGHPKESNDNIAVAAGVYESKASTINLDHNASFSIQSYFDKSSLQRLPSDTIFVFTDTGRLAIRNTVQNTGLFFSPQVRITNGNGNGEGIHFFLSFYTELIWQHITSDFDVTAMSRRDTIRLLRKDLSASGYSGRIETSPHDFFSHYDGIGLPIFAKEGTANLYINPVFGITNQPSSEVIESILNLSNNAGSYQRGKVAWNPFYLVQFRLNEEKYGLSFSGEVRQLIGSRSNPFVTLLLSKKFNLQRLVEFAK